MARTIQVDDNTYVGYDYLTKYFYVTHKSTMTTRLSANEAKGIIDILNPENTVTLDDLNNIATTIEELTDIYYALEDSGLGVEAIRFNTYKYFPLIYTGTTLRIGNTSIVHKINNHTVPSKVVKAIQNFYLRSIGLDISYNDLYAIYTYLRNSSYNLPVYNGIAERESIEEPVYFNNILNTLSTSKVTYSVTYNPNDIYTYNTLENKILYANPILNSFTVQGDCTSILTERTKIKVSGCNIYVGSVVYSDDGDYIVVSSTASNGTTLVSVAEQIPYEYNPSFEIYSAKAENNSIALNGTYPYGDLLQGISFSVTGSSTIDGNYTIKSVQINDYAQTQIFVNEDIQADYTAPEGGPYPVFQLTNLPSISKGIPDSSMLLNVTSSKYPNKFPVGEFMLDNPEQLTEYINLSNTYVSNNIPIPTQDNYNNINSEIPSTLDVDGLSLPMQFEGLYTEIYSE